MTRLTLLPRRGVVEIAGADRVGFLQGLVSNDVAEVAPGRAVWAALLTPQGKWLADFFILGEGERLLLDCERAQAALLVQKLSRFRLRAKVSVRDLSGELAVHAAWNGEWSAAVGIPANEFAGGPVPAACAPEARAPAIAAPDPRLPDAGLRILAETPLTANASEAEWDAHRLSLGLPDGSRDLEAEKTVLLEAGFDELHGVSWTKGCYLGQELTARTKYRGLVKRRLVPVEVAGELPEPGTVVMARGREVGTMRSGQGRLGLALLRIDALDEALSCGDATLVARIPDWMALPQSAS